MMILGGVSENEVKEHQWQSWLEQLALERRACEVLINHSRIWVAAEKLNLWQTLHPELIRTPEIDPVGSGECESINIAIIEFLRMRLQGMGPVAENVMGDCLQLNVEQINLGMLALEQEGYAMRGNFDLPISQRIQWCERGLLARIHRRTIKNLRKQIQPISINGFMRYLFEWHGMNPDSQSEQNDPESLATILQQLEGIEVSAAAWEDAVLPVRLNNYMTYWLDILCSSGRVTWLN